MSDEFDEYLHNLYNGDDEEEYEDQEIHYYYIETLDAPRELPEPQELTKQCVKEIADELGLITLCWPDLEHVEFENRTHFPESYTQNSDKEKLLLLYTENFRKQFTYKFPNRKPLFLATENECGLQKMVCSTIRPTTLSYPEIEAWDTCAKFLGSHLRYEPFDYATLLPNRLYSPHTTFLRQSGQAHEIATALCSLLIGQGYDAYVVFGYATRDVTKQIMIRVESPYPPEEESQGETDADQHKSKYNVKPARDLTSKFLQKMEQRKIDKVKAEEQRLADIEQAKREEEKKHPHDDLAGMRFHFWVLMRETGRQVENGPFFIEPSTGTAYPISTSNYIGIESVWNNINYWVNMQDCTKGLGEINYDLTNIEKWEHLLVGEPISCREIKEDFQMEEDEQALAKIMDEKHLDMPFSWSTRISIPHHVLKQKYPDGVKITQYNRTLVEEFAPYIQRDGLITRITRYDDFDCTKCIKTEERFQNRQDRLIKIDHDFVSDVIREYFGRGREDAVLKHSYVNDPKEGAKRRIRFNHQARYDGLLKIELDDEKMVEEYINREDSFYYREVKFAKKGKPPPGYTEGHRKIIIKIMETFSRNPKIPFQDDIATREFAVVDRKIYLKYHFGEGKVTATTRNFIKPPVAEMSRGLVFRPELTYGYQSEVGAKPPTQVELITLLMRMIDAEAASIAHIREIEDHVTEFLELRDREMALPKLDVSLFNREQNEEYRLGMLEKEKEELEYQVKQIEDVDIDYLAPYMVKLRGSKKMTRSQANQLKTECLNDFKQLLFNRAIDIQKQFEKWTDFLKAKQLWFHINQDTVTEEEETKYFQDVNDLNFLLQTYEIRLARHRDLSPIRYETLVRFINSKLKLS